jgi:hypothetical protein
VEGAHLADDDEVFPGGRAVGRERPADVGIDVAARIEGRGVDVVDAEFDGAAQHRGGVLRG